MVTYDFELASVQFQSHGSKRRLLLINTCLIKQNDAAVHTGWKKVRFILNLNQVEIESHDCFWIGNSLNKLLQNTFDVVFQFLVVKCSGIRISFQIYFNPSSTGIWFRGKFGFSWSLKRPKKLNCVQIAIFNLDIWIFHLFQDTIFAHFIFLLIFLIFKVNWYLKLSILILRLTSNFYCV